jgi:hypothetical protein
MSSKTLTGIFSAIGPVFGSVLETSAPSMSASKPIAKIIETANLPAMFTKANIIVGTQAPNYQKTLALAVKQALVKFASFQSAEITLDSEPSLSDVDLRVTIGSQAQNSITATVLKEDSNANATYLSQQKDTGFNIVLSTTGQKPYVPTVILSGRNDDNIVTGVKAFVDSVVQRGSAVLKESLIKWLIKSPMRASVTAIQMAVVPGNKKANLLKALKMIDNATAQKDTDLILLPELFSTGPVSNDILSLAETIPGPTTDTLAAKAKEKNAYIIASLLEAAGGKLYSTAVLIEPNGSIVGSIGKLTSMMLKRNI